MKRPDRHNPGRVRHTQAPTSHAALLSVRAAVVLLASVIGGGAALMLTLATGASWPYALLACGAAFSGALGLFNQVVGDRLL
jgi:hypothetical protein